MAETHSHEDHTSGHPTWRTYVVVGFILTAITAIEVAIFYIESLSAVLVPSLLILSALKFAIVVLFYMHLKFDSKIFGRVFFAPLFLAALVVIGMILLFKVLPAIELR
ncbi:MAG TPA: cytochrome C oxidase subunit IV family protein [Longimicrobiales bacterium]